MASEVSATTKDNSGTKGADQPATTAGDEEPAQLSWYGETTTSNYESVVEHNARFTQMRMQALRVVMKILRDAIVPFWLDCGSLLGAWRNKKMLPHDFDIDLSVLDDENFSKARKALIDHIPKRYSLLDGTAYAEKMEVDDDESGKYTLPCGIVWPNVSIDVNKFATRPEDGTLKQLYHNYNLSERRYKPEWVFPLEEIEFEGEMIPCPRDIVPYLEEMYGYLGSDFKYDPVSMKFVQKDAVLTAKPKVEI